LFSIRSNQGRLLRSAFGFACIVTVAIHLEVMNSSAVAEDTVEPYQAHVYTSANGQTLPYHLLSPENVEEGKRYPLVLFLHGAGERGTNNISQLVHVARELSKPEMRSRFPVFVIAPQCPTGQQWVDTPWTADSHTMPEQPSASMKLTIELLDQASQSLPIDPARIYVTGLSMGGFGVWDLLQRHSQKFAGAIAICGGGDPAFADKIKQVPIWATHGDADTVVKVKRSREMIDAIRAAGGRPIYTEFPGVGHNAWAPTAQNRMIWDWLFTQRHDGTSP